MNTPINSQLWRSISEGVFDDISCASRSYNINSGKVVFCKIDHALCFFEKLRLTRRRVILITGEGDLPCDEFRQKYLPANVVRWFATNVTYPHPRVTALPLGLGAASDPVTLSSDQIVDGRNQSPPREKWLYVNFRPQTNPSVRQPIFDHFASMASSQSWITLENPDDQGGGEKYLQNLISHKFVLCPPGNGVDTHRMWESLAAGAIPVVLRSMAMEPFKELPILFVDRYQDVSLELLQDASHCMVPPEGGESMMQAEYWLNKIREARRLLHGNEIMPCAMWIRESIKYAIEMAGRRVRI